MKHVRWTSLLAIAACMLLLASCSSDSPRQTVKSFYAAVADGNTDQAMKLVTFEEMDESNQPLDKRKFKAAVDTMHTMIQKNDGLDSLEFTDTSKIDDKHVKMSLTIHYGNGDTDMVRDQSMKKTADGWKLAPQ